MRLLLHTGTGKLHRELLDNYPERFGWLVTPASGCRQVPERWYLACDNGCFHREACPVEFPRFVAHYTQAQWVVLPDVVGDAGATREASLLWRDRLEVAGLSRPWAYVLQDGFDVLQFPDGMSAVFLGGTDDFKMSQEAKAALLCPQERGLHTHVGRVNSTRRMRSFEGYADSVDGSNFTAWVCNPATRRILRRHARQMEFSL